MSSNEPTQIRLALVQPVTHAPPNDEKNLDAALQAIENAARSDADLVAFPESYPGPWQTPLSFDPTEVIAETASDHDIYVQFGSLEPLSSGSRAAYNVLKLVGPDLDEPGVYRRTHPPGPWIYSGGIWDFDYQVGDSYPVFDTRFGVVGLAMCSEAFMPEVTRALALRGAEVILLPAGTDKKKLYGQWRNLIRARATENLAIVATTQNVFSASETGLAMVATPESVIFESSTAGMFLVDVDLERIREMRDGVDTDGSSEVYGAKPGVLQQWQRPEMYQKLFPGDVEA